MKTNIGGRFLDLIDRCFPKGTLMGKVFNRNNLKMSYRTCPNMKQVLAKHNKKVLAASKPKEEEERTCDCPKAIKKAGTCPLQGHCLGKNIIYQATVVEIKPNGERVVETYVGCCSTTWKERYRNHNKSFKHLRYKGETILSTHIWEIKDRGSTYTISWRILDRGNPFTPVTKVCMLCTKEKFYILRRTELSTLNSRQEVGNHCMHIVMSLLSKVEKVKVDDE